MITFVEKYRAYLGSAPFKLRVDNRALAWLKTYSMDQSYVGRWIVRLDGYHMIIEHRTRDKHQNADSLSKMTEFYERLEERQANQSEIKDGFSFLDKETYDKLPLTRWLDKSGHPIPGHPDLPVETAAEIKLLARGEPVPLDLLVRSNLVQQELTRLGINSMALLNRTVNVAPDVMGKLRDLLKGKWIGMIVNGWRPCSGWLSPREQRRGQCPFAAEALNGIAGRLSTSW